jgi:hypothetical protein
MFCHSWYLNPFPGDGNMIAGYFRQGVFAPALAEYYSKRKLKFYGSQGHPEGFFKKPKIFFKKPKIEDRSQFGKVLFMKWLYKAGVLYNILGPKPQAE